MTQVQSAVLFAFLVVAAPLAIAQDQATQTSLPAALDAGGTPYFTAKMDNLTKTLQLSDDQQAKIRPIAVQEVGYLEQIRRNPVLSKKEKLKKLTAIVQDSDKQMKPVLSSDQWQKLQLMRKDQKAELEKLAEAPAPTATN